MPITLYIVRHAKAEDRAMFMADHDRRLTPEGTMAAARMGRYLRSKSIRPDVVVSSTAPRAADTARMLTEQLGIDPAQIRLDGSLFDGGPKAYLAVVNELPDTVQSVMIVGHNPDVSYFAEFLTHQSIGSMSKGAVIAVTFGDMTWAGVSGRTGSIAFQVTPKQLTGQEE
ncbi:SixA phosphatase family protein [Spirosoma utsteinense]|uniref:Phosphohistidine phosphatase n=1 Tax=Spirosoma utsteinense TaxID=2585773 RepID=A0ABR6WDT7_9BACT|nr:histidine phosphatase family protein [Spirosoma utsteinense]MBC3788769.1 phosphohistidine phosphatase [Spirosoma utsteinense]MBC3794722.1 phosphohistidine phosphatase [Spirosoma utsteinense]